jgi:cephalosporin hydroxylase
MNSFDIQSFIITIDELVFSHTGEPLDDLQHEILEGVVNHQKYAEIAQKNHRSQKYIKETAGNKSVMVVLDSDHSRQHVKRELVYYSDIVTSGQYLVLEDCYMFKTGEGLLAGPGEARDWFLKRSKKLVQTNLDQLYLVGFCRGGWLKKI